MVITIDGPTASGKSTAARLLAHQLGGYAYLNTGLLYRALAYLLVHCYQYTDHMLMEPCPADAQAILDQHRLLYCYDDKQAASIWFDAINITSFLKTLAVDRWASLVSAHPAIRLLILDFQRDFAEKRDVVAEGRDCGSVVFPCADYKFFLTASLETRACRWQQDQAHQGKHFSMQQSLSALIERDERDSQRAVAPLTIPAQAHVIDTSCSSIPEVIQALLKFIKS
jgi:CMP/dCMP kinase